MKVIILIPTYNEKKNIERLLKKILKVIKDVKVWKIEILVVDGNSPDGTREIVLNFKKKHKNIHLLTETKKKGLGAAYLSGIDYAIKTLNSDIIMTMDADLSHNPDYIPDFLKKVEEGADLVIGSRYIKGGSIPREWALHRKIYSILGNKVASFILGTNKINDWTSGYRAISKKVYLKVRPQVLGKSTQGYTFNMCFAYYALEYGFAVDHTPIKFPDRQAGESKLGLEYLVRTPIFLVRTRLRRLLPVS